ncbi:tetrahydrofolate dehydrogenase/cyclohydrolase catalytic domain-containing protein [Priestia megaterium]|uniref:tetrahydrofolate dehydrogenase/cyclohydrolase catalytic domain-containing protein n=1 Tax=Priestia megaterium TaxID=1404 RepID=UPI000BF68B92|nr:tetrahydrofolate dehydrogenase/cyclohydrolase catalytic domain-containing protein [Priestia megaterium]MUL34581.1 Bifunctional protein FolD protein [Priestia megaterium]PER67575.1 hypothetical protein CN492_25255 [Priestia megaterium]
MKKILEGKIIQEKIIRELREDLKSLKNKYNATPGLALIMIEDESPLIEVNHRLHVGIAKQLGYNVFETVFPNDIYEREIISVIDNYNKNEDVHGILILLPVPKHVSIQNLINAINPDKEIEGFHLDNASRFLPTSNKEVKYPMCVPEAVNELMKPLHDQYNNVDYVIVVDKEIEQVNPIAKMVIRMGSVMNPPLGAKSIKVINTDCDDVIEHSKQADVLIVSTLKPKLVNKEWVKNGACIIDFNPIPVEFKKWENKVVPVFSGGVDIESAKDTASYIAPAPGGVGPVMLAVLMRNLYLTTLRQLASRELELVKG